MGPDLQLGLCAFTVYDMRAGMCRHDTHGRRQLSDMQHASTYNTRQHDAPARELDR